MSRFQRIYISVQVVRPAFLFRARFLFWPSFLIPPQRAATPARRFAPGHRRSSLYSSKRMAADSGAMAAHRCTRISPAGDTTTMPLVEAVLQQSRLDALTACDANLARYDPNSFLVIFRCRGRQMPFLIKPLLVLMIWSVAWLLIFERFEHFRDTIMPLEDLVTPLLTPVSFLLVFRLGRSAVRWWDARAAAGKLVEICRSMASSAAVSCASQPELVDGIARWSCRVSSPSYHPWSCRASSRSYHLWICGASSRSYHPVGWAGGAA